jgi:hypothetical protein
MLYDYLWLGLTDSSNPEFIALGMSLLIDEDYDCRTSVLTISSAPVTTTDDFYELIFFVVILLRAPVWLSELEACTILSTS